MSNKRGIKLQSPLVVNGATKSTYHGYHHDIPADWEVMKIGELIKFSGGSQPPLSTFEFEEQEGYLRLIQTRDYRTDRYKTFIKETDAKKTCKEDDIMIGRYGPPIFQIFSGLAGAYNVALMKAVPNEKLVLKKYAFYYLSRPELRIYLESLSQRSGGQTGVEVDRLNKYPFPLPPLEEQRRVVGILNTFDIAINKTQKLIDQIKLRNKGLAQQLLTGKKRLKGFEGEWMTVHIGQIADQVNLINNKAEDLEVLSCTKYDGLVRSLDYFGRRVFGEDISKYKIVPKDTFAYATNHIEEGSIGYQNFLDKALISPMYTAFKTNGEMHDGFLYRLLKSEKMIYEYQSNMSGSIDRRGGLRWDDFSTLKITIPDYNVQQAIDKVLGMADEELNLLDKRITGLKEQKKGLMQKLLTGEIRVKIQK